MKIVGLISGTSADGIDAALCEISGAPPALDARILHAISHPYPDGLQARVLDASMVTSKLPISAGVPSITPDAASSESPSGRRPERTA